MADIRTQASWQEKPAGKSSCRICVSFDPSAQTCGLHHFPSGPDCYCLGFSRGNLQPTGQALEAMIGARQINQIQTSELVGAMRMADVQGKFAAVARTKILKEIKESENFMGAMLAGPNGGLVECKSWKQFVELTQSESLDKIDEDIRNLSVFGDGFMEASNRMGLGYRQLRMLRKLPEEDRQAVAAEVETNLGDKDAVLALIDGLTERHAKEKGRLEAELQKKEKELERKTRHVDAIVKAETETLTAEVEGYAKKVGELEAQLGGGDWDKANAAADQLAAKVGDLRKDVDAFHRLMPPTGHPPATLAASIAASLFHVRELADGLWRQWEDRAAMGGEE